jgi:hypothetical protein
VKRFDDVAAATFPSSLGREMILYAYVSLSDAQKLRLFYLLDVVYALKI